MNMEIAVFREVKTFIWKIPTSFS